MKSELLVSLNDLFPQGTYKRAYTATYKDGRLRVRLHAVNFPPKQRNVKKLEKLSKQVTAALQTVGWQRVETQVGLYDCVQKGQDEKYVNVRVTATKEQP